MFAEGFIRDTLAAAKRTTYIIEPAANFFGPCALPTMKNYFAIQTLSVLSHVVGDRSLQQCREMCLRPAQSTVSSSPGWNIMWSSAAHGMFPVLPEGITTVTWSFQHWILAAVGSAVLCPLQWDQQRRQSAALPRDAGAQNLCPGLVRPAFSTCTDWAPLSSPRVGLKGCCSLLC